MKRPWENDSCSILQATHSIYHVPVAAALWCGVPANQVTEELSRASPVGQTALGRATLRHPYISCLEVRIRAIHAAIDAGKLDSCKEDGNKVDGHIAYERRHVYGADLKEWAKAIVPNERPAFLFDEIERQAHSTITTKVYEAMKAERDAARADVQKLRTGAETTGFQIAAMEKQIVELNAKLKAADVPGDRAETTYLNIIGAMLALMLGKSPNGQAYSVLDNQSAIIAALLGHHEGKPGISARTLEDKFAAAKRSLTAG